MTPVDTTLAEYRTAGDCQLVLPPTVTPAFRVGPAYRVGIAHLLLKPRFLLADPTGVGKTVHAVVAAAKLKHKVPGRHALVLTPLSALEQWRDEVEKFTDGLTVQIAGVDAQGRDLPPARRVEQYAARPDFLITTYDTAIRDADHIRAARFAEGLIFIWDEVQALRGLWQTKRRPTLIELGRLAEYVWGLSATPMSKDLWELYSVFDAIQPGCLGSEAAFAAQYMDRVWISFEKKVPGRPKRKFGGPGKWHIRRYKHLDELKATLRTLALRRPVEAFGATLPALTTQKCIVPMAPDHRQAYEQVIRQLAKVVPLSNRGDGSALAEGYTLSPSEKLNDRLTLPGGRKSGLGQAHAVLYAQMVSDAPALFGVAVKDKYPAKLIELLRQLRENFSEDRVLVFTKSRKVADWLTETLAAEGLMVSKITGRTTDREAVRQAFQQDDPPEGQRGCSSRILVLTLAGKEALNLQAARVVVCYDIPYGSLDLRQLVGRARRVGSSHASVLCLFLCHAQSVDTACLKIVEQRLHHVNQAFTTAFTDTKTTTVATAETEALAQASASHALALKSPSIEEEGTDLKEEDPDQAHPLDASVTAYLFAAIQRDVGPGSSELSPIALPADVDEDEGPSLEANGTPPPSAH